MIREFIKYVWYFFFFVLFQVLILNNIQFSGLINPYLYILFLLLLPFETPKFILLLLAFLLGLSIDSFSDTMGMHSSACLAMAFVRPYLLKYISPRDGYELGSKPRLSEFGFSWYLRYSTLLVAVHHVVLFYLEAFTFDNFLYTLARSILSMFFTLVLILLSQFLVYSNRRTY